MGRLLRLVVDQQRVVLQRDDGEILTCTLASANRVGNEPFPPTPFDAVTYAANIAFYGVDYAICVLI